MKLAIIGFVFAFIFAGSVDVLAQRTETARVQVNREKRLPKSKLSIRFTELIEDSRCPTGTNCVWAGNAKIRISVRRSGRSAQSFELETNGAGNSVNYQGYKITLTALTPHPAINIRINRNGYVATLAVSRT